MRYARCVRVDAADLATFPPLAGLPRAALNEVAQVTSAEEHPADHAIFREGDPAGDLYVVRRGRVQLSQRFEGRGAVAVLTLSDGELLGWSALLRRPRVASARTLTPTTLWRFDTSALLELCEGDPRVGYRVMAMAFEELADRLYATRLQLLDVFGAR